MPVDRETMNATLPGLLAYSKAVDGRTQNAYQEHLLLSPSQRLEILQCYADTNAHIARKYLGREDGVLFEEPSTDPTVEWTPYPGLSEEVLRAIVCFLAGMTPDVAKLLASAAPYADRTDHELQRLSNALIRFVRPFTTVSYWKGLSAKYKKLFEYSAMSKHITKWSPRT
jgi:hypothetical protein